MIKSGGMNSNIFIENAEEYNQIIKLLQKEKYSLGITINYNDGIYTFHNCTKLGDTLVYKITARMIEEELDYLPEIIGMYVDDDWEI